MKRISKICSRAILAALLLAVPCEVAAQSSVRRTPKKEAATPAADSEKGKGKGSTSTTTKPKTTKPKSSTKPATTKKPTTKPATTKPATTSDNDSAPVARRTAPKKGAAAPSGSVADDATLRSQQFDEYQKREEHDTPWQRTIYRELDVTHGDNASLYYPTEPMDGLTNFFRVILDLVVTGKVTAYEYLDGREVFTDKYVVKVKDVLDKYQILYVEKPATGKTPASYTIEESDVPCEEILSYFVKERWEFDNATSSYGPRVLAVCPVLHRAGDFGGEPFKYPLFWLRYEDLRPYLRKQLIVSDGMNAAPRYTMEDFFSLQQYDGDIYKVQNLRGLSLMQQYPNPDTLKMARARIEAELSGFRDSIWMRELTAEEIAAASKNPARARAARTAADSTTVVTTDKTKRNRRTRATVDVGAAEAERAAQQDAAAAEAERTGKAHSVRRSRR